MMDTDEEQSRRLVWEWGTGYDMFMSMAVLHHPNDFGVDGMWASGIRSRLPAEAREILQQVTPFVEEPYHWVHSLPAPKDGETVLWALRQVPAEERLLTLVLPHRLDLPGDPVGIVRRVVNQRSWDESDVEALWGALNRGNWHVGAAKEATRQLLDWGTRPAEFGERYLHALRTYYEVFFGEEEQRIAPYLRRGVEQAQEWASELALPELLERLSQGLRLEPLPEHPTWVLTPSFWCSPLVTYGPIDDERMFFQFGARPANASLVPGGEVPDALMNVLKALSNPTRLRILHYLTSETLSPAELARRLRLRAPTVTHHLSALRLAGLVYLTVEGEGEGRYAARAETIDNMVVGLGQFLQGEDLPT